ncbi:putative acid phosphatase [Yarrowia sp. C11]|nr:putative acid phosphatase [Yarrowia sp. C11]KAG5364008.1 putative acid phosphatase [Yarrowia sp. E02]
MKLTVLTLASTVAAAGFTPGLAETQTQAYNGDKKTLYTNAPVIPVKTPSLAEIQAAAATATSNSFKEKKTVKGKAFDRYHQIWLENTDYKKAFDQPGLNALTKEGIVLTNYFAVTHPSQPNYVAVVGGDYFGIFDDIYRAVPEEIFTVADLLDSKGISWGEYQEHMPYTGFEGFNYSRQSDDANDYVRKHNPLVMYDSVSNKPERLGNIKNFTEFEKDVANNDLPQWAFITPNMTNDGHDTDIETSGTWSFDFLTPLLNNTEFMKDNLIILTFDESETYYEQNRVFALLLGGAIPEHLKGTTDDTVYNHYSNLATVQANWGLPHLGRGDVTANVFKFVADKVGSSVTNHNITQEGLYNNFSYPGYFSDESLGFPTPLIDATGTSGNKILPAIADLVVKSDNSSVSTTNSTAGHNATMPKTSVVHNENSAQLAVVSLGAALVGVAALLM